MIDDDQKCTRKRWLKPAGVVLKPGLTGMTVIEAKNGAESLIGRTFPWYRIMIIQSNSTYTLHLRDERDAFLKVDSKRVWVKFKGSGKLICRLQSRAARVWARESDEPIGFEPKEESVWIWIPVMMVMGSGCVYLMSRMFTKIPSGMFSPPFTKWTVIAGIAALLVLAFPLLGMLMFWSLRPRPRDFESIDLMPTGIVGTTKLGEVVSLEFAELAECKLRMGNPLRCSMRTEDGRLYWMALPNPISLFAQHAINPSNKSQRELKRKAIRNLYRQSFRLLILGVVCAGGSYVLINFLVSIGAILPANTQRIRNSIAAFSFGFPAMVAALLMWQAWSYSSSGLRTRKKARALLSRSRRTSL
tara:strand:+ start:270 stop:1346 length:1077 start_codon:yes stop_codon:yes gene_type:complete